MGFTIDSRRLAISVPNKKAKAVRHRIKKIIRQANSNKLAIRHLASTIGQIIALMLPAIPYARLHARHLYNLQTDVRAGKGTCRCVSLLLHGPNYSGGRNTFRYSAVSAFTQSEVQGDNSGGDRRVRLHDRWSVSLTSGLPSLDSHPHPIRAALAHLRQGTSSRRRVHFQFPQPGGEIHQLSGGQPTSSIRNQQVVDSAAGHDTIPNRPSLLGTPH